MIVPGVIYFRDSFIVWIQSVVRDYRLASTKRTTEENDIVIGDGIFIKHISEGTVVKVLEEPFYWIIFRKTEGNIRISIQKSVFDNGLEVFSIESIEIRKEIILVWIDIEILVEKKVTFLNIVGIVEVLFRLVSSTLEGLRTSIIGISKVIISIFGKNFRLRIGVNWDISFWQLLIGVTLTIHLVIGIVGCYFD